jgi:hypothetical protein
VTTPAPVARDAARRARPVPQLARPAGPARAAARGAAAVAPPAARPPLPDPPEARSGARPPRGPAARRLTR